MQTTLQPTFSNTHINIRPRTNRFSTFISWCASQDGNRYGWQGLMLGLHGCLLTPITVFAIMLSGNSLVLWMAAISAMMMTLVANLAALPTKYTIPVFLFSVLLDVVLIAASLSMGLDFSRLYA